jgi:hypothetical protein
MQKMRATTILAVRHQGVTAIGGDDGAQRACSPQPRCHCAEGLMGIINEEMEPGEGPAHEQAETPPVEQQEDQAEASGMPEQDGMSEDDPTPEEEDAYEKGVIAIMRTLYDSGAADDIVAP